MNTEQTSSDHATKATPKRKINWKLQRKREDFFLKHGRFPSKRELKRAGKLREPILFFGYRT